MITNRALGHKHPRHSSEPDLPEFFERLKKMKTLNSRHKHFEFLVGVVPSNHQSSLWRIKPNIERGTVREPYALLLLSDLFRRVVWEDRVRFVLVVRDMLIQHPGIPYCSWTSLQGRGRLQNWGYYSIVQLPTIFIYDWGHIEAPFSFIRDVKSKLGIWCVRMAVRQIPPKSPEEAEITTPCSLQNGMCNATKPDWLVSTFLYTSC